MIAGEGNPVVQVANFDELQGMIDKIKSSACSGKLTFKKAAKRVEGRAKLKLGFTGSKMSSIRI